MLTLAGDLEEGRKETDKLESDHHCLCKASAVFWATEITP